MRFRRGRGQAVVEFAIVTPILLLLLLGAFDVGTLMLEREVAQGGAQTIADLAASGILEDDPLILSEVARCCADADWSITYDGPLVLASLTCAHASPTTLMPDTFVATATAVLEGGEAIP